MNAKSNAPFLKTLLYDIILGGIVLFIGWGIDGPSAVRAQEAETAKSRPLT